MTLVLDLRAPVIVFAAKFNPAIFDIGWIARHIYGKDEGTNIAVSEIIGQMDQTFIHLKFIDGVAVSVSAERTEIFAINDRAETFDKVEHFILKMIEILPHTPVSAIGCNFRFSDDDPSSDVVALFDPRENLDDFGVLNARQSGAQIQISSREILNFTRAISRESASYSFNYHIAENDALRYPSFMRGFIQRSLKYSIDLLSSCFGYLKHDVICFSNEDEREEAEDDSKGTD